ncbi:DUF2384 domain-containing protein [Glaciecola sp. MH2013]|uniref:MbcA/ParS/Xre antitoxin family protein n=1 Tax=Glaciecola sp. MH2013 TaxID=2785524 RepID=UPI00189E3132|nr:MbcA/ParS/Xre antitoxin family protein [Glaciecola sp. MH2013]MBF7073987.1 DUF2384 domain-containing protein [Glaciecola sp. MH2013]
MHASIEEHSSTPTQVVTKALFNVKDELGVSQEVIGQIIGADAATVSRMQKRMDMKQNRVYETAVILIRIYRSLYTILGGSSDAIKHWLNTNNKDFMGRPPIDNMKNIVGLINTAEYLDSMRGRT